MNYKNVNILAPMVRVSTLPMRLLAIKYGADLAYSEEIVDFKLLKSKRIVNDKLQTVDFVMEDGTVVFRTCDKEKDKVVLQIATVDADRGLEAAKMVENDVAAIDLNMGCPKDYSIKGGMGAAMLKNPANSCKVLKNLATNLSIPVTCKIRVLRNMESTIDLIKQLCETGIKAIAVHGRFTEERPSHPVHNDIIKELSTHMTNGVVLIANGGSIEHIKNYEDIEYFKQICGAESVMIARAAMYKPCIFKDFSEGIDPPTSHDLLIEYLKLASQYDNYLGSTKYCIVQILNETTECPGYRETLSAANHLELCDIWGISDFYKSLFEEVKDNDDDLTLATPPKKPRLQHYPINQHHIIEIDTNQYSGQYSRRVHGKCKFLKRLYGKTGWSPKLCLYHYCDKNKLKTPKFDIIEVKESRLFHSTLILNDVLYTNQLGDKNKRFVEQAIACICLQHLGILPDHLVENGLYIELLL